MAVIGIFSAVNDGYAGTIRTITMNARVKIVANERKETEAAPDFRVMLSATEIGAAWRRTKQGSDQSYLRVRLDDPRLAAADMGQPDGSCRRRHRPVDLAPR
jgi:uncharacterized protein (DUF736 family)